MQRAALPQPPNRLAGKRERREEEIRSSKALSLRRNGNAAILARHRNNSSNNNGNGYNSGSNNSNNNGNGSAPVERHTIRPFGVPRTNGHGAAAAATGRLVARNNGSAGVGGVPRVAMQAHVPAGTLRRSPQQTSLQSLPGAYMQHSNNNNYGSNNNLVGAFGHMRLGLPLGNNSNNNIGPRPMSTLPVARPMARPSTPYTLAPASFAAPVARRPLSTLPEGSQSSILALPSGEQIDRKSSSGGAKRRRSRSTKKVTKRKSGAKAVKRKSIKSRKSKKRV